MRCAKAVSNTERNKHNFYDEHAFLDKNMRHSYASASVNPISMQSKIKNMSASSVNMHTQKSDTLSNSGCR